MIYKGEITDTYCEYSDTLLMFLLNGRRPERFSQRASIEHTGKARRPPHRGVDRSDRRGDRPAAYGTRRDGLGRPKQSSCVQSYVHEAE